VVVRDLAELREAIYIDLSTDGASALQAVIQERPVEIVPLPDGSMQVFYEYNRPSYTVATAPDLHGVQKQIPSDAASDAIIYGSDEVVTYQFPNFSAILGLSTKLFRFPNLDIGAVEATIRTLRKTFQRKKMTTISVRPQLAPLVGERLTFSYTKPATAEVVSDEMIIESTSIQFSNQGKVSATMTINGREYTV
jgi:hypothetical protein